MQQVSVYLGRRSNRTILHLVDVEGVGTAERLDVYTIRNVTKLMLHIICVVVGGAALTV